MASYKFSIDLTKVDGAVVKTNSDGKKAVILPIEEGDLYESEKGNVYLSLVMWENENKGEYGQTHTIKKSYSLTAREKYGADALKLKPVLGSAKILEKRKNSSVVAPNNAPNTPSTNDYSNDW